MEHRPKSIRPFIGSKDFDISRHFYRDIGFTESVIDDGMSYFHADGFGFYLQKYYVRDWIDNTMVFLEVDSAERYYEELAALDLPSKYQGVRLTQVRHDYWGSECFLHDPSGNLWHFGTFHTIEQ